MSILTVLRRIVQEVGNARDLREALNIMVQNVRQAIETQACSIFLLDRTFNEYVLMATDGLNPKAVGEVRLGAEQGLVGLVASRGEPININDAPSHPNYYHHPIVTEDRFKVFLGVPIIHNRQVLGILIVQQEGERRYDESEEAFLVTISAQLAGVIAHSVATGAITRLLKKPGEREHTKQGKYVGTPSVPGVGIGTAVVVYSLKDLDAIPEEPAEDIVAEIQLFETALNITRDDISSLCDKIQATLAAEDSELFDAYLRILEDDTFYQQVIAHIEQGHWAQGALRKVINEYVEQFEAMNDDYLQERATDIKDLGRRILANLQSQEKMVREYPEKVVLIGEEVTASALAEVPEGRLAAIVSARGTRNSHVAILARALAIPTVMGVENLDTSNMDGLDIVVDGYEGQIYVAPNPRIFKQFLTLAKEESELNADLEQLRHLPAATPDGHDIKLMVNTGLLADAGLSLMAGAEGIGLYRTEVSFMGKERFPAEEEQRCVYRQLLTSFAPRPVTMRTLDIGGDKALPYFPVEEENPFLGWRGIRITLDHPELFRMQMRAMLRANIGLGNLRILFPMVCGMAELDDALALLKQAYQEVKDEEGDKVIFPPVGVMIEVPSAVYLSRSFARRLDFLSVGTNDLTQYMLAVDRNNSRVANLYDGLHPAVLWSLKTIVENAHKEGITACVCGELAGDPAAAILLLAMGYDSLSMSAPSLPRAKWVIRNFSMYRAKQLLDEVFAMDDPKFIRKHLYNALDEEGLGGLIRAGKR